MEVDQEAEHISKTPLAIIPALASMEEASLLVRGIVAWSSLSMFGHIMGGGNIVCGGAEGLGNADAYGSGV